MHISVHLKGRLHTDVIHIHFALYELVTLHIDVDSTIKITIHNIILLYYKFYLSYDE